MTATSQKLNRPLRDWRDVWLSVYLPREMAEMERKQSNDAR